MANFFLFSFIFACSLTAFVFALGKNPDQFIKFAPDVSIFETPGGNPGSLAEVNGVTSCGGPAEVIDWRYEPCYGESTCQAPADDVNYPLEVTFIPSESIAEGLGIRLNVTAPEIPSRLYELLIPDSVVRGGRTYTILSAGGPGEKFHGKRMTFQYIIFRQVDKFVEACAQTHFQIV